MKITITPTAKLTEFEGSPVRLWEGITESGVACFVFVRSVAVRDSADHSQFERELSEIPAPGSAIPLRMIL